MRKSNLAIKPSFENNIEVVCAEKVTMKNDHIHAANCGHKSYVHNGHICYESEGHFHYRHEEHFHECPGPHAKKNK